MQRSFQNYIQTADTGKRELLRKIALKLPVHLIMDFPLHLNAASAKETPRRIQRAMDVLLKKVKWQFALVYLNGIIIFSGMPDEYISTMLTQF